MAPERGWLGPGPYDAVGLMVGTSLDGVDAAWVRCEARAGGSFDLRLRAHVTLPLVHAPAARLRALASGAAATAEEWSALRFALARDHEAAVRHVLGDVSPRRLDWVAAHGVTVAHFPRQRGGHGWQLNCGAALAAWLACPVVDDFRTADIALGGEGAPLAPVADLRLRVSAEEDRVILNLGGIANATLLPAGEPSTGPVFAADVGPANLPLDGLRRRQTGGAEPFDRDGAVAAAGRVHPSLRDRWLADAWARRPLPRSFGREEFGDPWLDAYREEAAGLTDADQMATLVDLEAQAVRIFVEELAGDWRVAPTRPLHLLVTGGGRRNRAVMRALSAALPTATVEPIEAIGVDGDAKEAMDFALLGALALRGDAAGADRVTGAARPLVLGSVHWPHPPTAPANPERRKDDLHA